MERQLHVMVFGAHAFDAEVMAAPVLAKYVKHGHRGTIVHLTRGERGHPTKPPEVYGPQLEREMKEAAAVLGCNVIWMGYKAGAIPTSEGIMLDICDLIRREKPDYVITHWRGSVHPRHTSTHENVVGGVRFAGAESVQRELPPHRVRGLYFGENCEDLDGFVPNTYIDITETYDQWFEALAKYELLTPKFRERDHEGKEIEAFPYEAYYRTMAIVRGHEVGFRYAKAFMSARAGYGFFPADGEA